MMKRSYASHMKPMPATILQQEEEGGTERRRQVSDRAHEFRDLADTDSGGSDSGSDSEKRKNRASDASGGSAFSGGAQLSLEAAKRAAARASAAGATAGKDAASPSNGSTAASPVAALFAHPLSQRADAFLRSHHPELHARSVQLQTLLEQVYATSSPLLRSLLQLYSYTMSRLPLQAQHAIRLYLLLLLLRQLMSIWRGFVLVRQGVRVTRGVIVAGAGGVKSISGGSRRRARRKAAAAKLTAAAAAASRSPTPAKRRSRSKSRSKSRSSSRSISPKSKSVSKRSSSAKKQSGGASSHSSSSVSPSRRARLRASASVPLDTLSDVLSRPGTVHAARLVADSVLPPPTANIVHQLVRGASQAAIARRGAISAESDSDREDPAARCLRR